MIHVHVYVHVVEYTFVTSYMYITWNINSIMYNGSDNISVIEIHVVMLVGTRAGL